ncbi:hypothetical protein PORCAN_1997 [Porphyromonas crevioricanis JCM 13913]|nr:hypothetical protein PORCAN_1997 [Porphyromonas crevioricanis JCM 13913]
MHRQFLPKAPGTESGIKYNSPSLGSRSRAKQGRRSLFNYLCEAMIVILLHERNSAKG